MIEAIEFETWESTNINLKGKSTGQVKTTCPQCSHNRKAHNRKDPCLSVHLDDQVFNCKNCAWNGYVRKMPKSAGSSKYENPKYEPQPLTEKLEKWFLEKRGITQETLQHFMVYPSRKWFRAVGEERPCIAFPYIERARVVNIKSRLDYIIEVDGQKHQNKTFSLEKGAKKILFNVDAVRGQKRVVITEGEPDCMIVHQSGFKPVCSVPNGAPPLSMRPGTDEPLPMNEQPQVTLDYLDDAAEIFKDAEEIIIATDGDLPGVRLRVEIARRLGKSRCSFVTWPEGYKDANEVYHGVPHLGLPGFGAEGVMQVLDEYVEKFPVEGVVRVEDINDALDDIYENGYPRGKAISHKEFSKLLTFREAEITTITGVPSHGKSEFVDEILVELAEMHQWPCAIFGAENGGAELHTVRLVHRAIQKPVVEDIAKNLFPKMDRDEWQRGKAWVNHFFNWIDLKKVGRNLDDILDKARELVINRGIKLLVIDPWNYLEGTRPSGMTETEFVSEAYAKILMFAEEYQVHVIVVAHPTKMLQNDDGTFRVPTLYSISGSANFYNKTFNGVTVYRDFNLGITDVHVQKVKFDFIGERGTATFKYNPFKRRYYEV